METSEEFNHRIKNSPREITISLSETDFKALTLWHVEASNNSIPSDFGKFILFQAMHHLQNKIFEAPQSFQAKMLMLIKGKDPYATNAEIESTTGFTYKQPKPGLFRNAPSIITWNYIGLGIPTGWHSFKPSWLK